MMQTTTLEDVRLAPFDEAYLLTIAGGKCQYRGCTSTDYVKTGFHKAHIIPELPHSPELQQQCDALTAEVCVLVPQDSKTWRIGTWSAITEPWPVLRNRNLDASSDAREQPGLHSGNSGSGERRQIDDRDAQNLALMCRTCGGKYDDCDAPQNKILLYEGEARREGWKLRIRLGRDTRERADEPLQLLGMHRLSRSERRSLEQVHAEVCRVMSYGNKEPGRMTAWGIGDASLQGAREYAVTAYKQHCEESRGKRPLADGLVNVLYSASHVFAYWCERARAGSANTDREAVHYRWLVKNWVRAWIHRMVELRLDGPLKQLEGNALLSAIQIEVIGPIRRMVSIGWAVENAVDAYIDMRRCQERFEFPRWSRKGDLRHLLQLVAVPDIVESKVRTILAGANLPRRPSTVAGFVRHVSTWTMLARGFLAAVPGYLRVAKRESRGAEDQVVENAWITACVKINAAAMVAAADVFAKLERNLAS